MTSIIQSFWRSNPQYWFPKTPTQKAEADDAIRTLFLDYDYLQENLVGQVIYLDQFTRHFDRGANLTPQRLDAARLVESNLAELLNYDDTDLVFCLMPFKHLGNYEFIFNYIHKTWLRGRAVTEFPTLSRFYNDTYTKAYTLDTVRDAIKDVHDEPFRYDALAITDSYPAEYADPSWSRQPHALSKLCDPQPAIISLSGGVDSMVMTALAKAPSVAVHILYGNRKESQQEYAFIAHYCHRLGIPLYTYTIPWLRRDCVDREFYERATRDLRFHVYAAVGERIGKPNPVVALGHIQDDLVENVWTNLAKGQHLSNLKKMARFETQQGVTIYRPFLNVKKADIIAAAKELAIPYLKNTTPTWSNRGKFRNTFYDATHAQFGPSVDSKLLEVADAYSEQARLVNALLYDPILKSGAESGKYNITHAVNVNMDICGWMYVLETICHSQGKTKPTIHAVRGFVDRLRAMKTLSMKVSLKGTVTANVDHVDEVWMLTLT